MRLERRTASRVPAEALRRRAPVAVARRPVMAGRSGVAQSLGPRHRAAEHRARRQAGRIRGTRGHGRTRGLAEHIVRGPKTFVDMATEVVRPETAAGAVVARGGSCGSAVVVEDEALRRVVTTRHPLSNRVRVADARSGIRAPTWEAGPEGRPRRPTRKAELEGRAWKRESCGKAKEAGGRNRTDGEATVVAAAFDVASDRTAAARQAVVGRTSTVRRHDRGRAIPARDGARPAST
jgi:hypothetical protein